MVTSPCCDSFSTSLQFFTLVNAAIQQPHLCNKTWNVSSHFYQGGCAAANNTMVPLLMAEFQYGFENFHNFMEVERICGKCDSFVQVIEPRFDCKHIFSTHSPHVALPPLSQPSASISYAFDLCFGSNLNEAGAGPKNISLQQISANSLITNRSCLPQLDPVQIMLTSHQRLEIIPAPEARRSVLDVGR
jgi:hypothetical protein